jgi:hypothetical protein
MPYWQPDEGVLLNNLGVDFIMPVRSNLAGTSSLALYALLAQRSLTDRCCLSMTRCF